jgi:RNA polymerase sigma-70 factor (ECF subfamily)
MSYLREPDLDSRFQPFVVFEQGFGFVPRLFRVESLLPRLLDVEARLAQVLEYDDGALPRLLKEQIHFAVAMARRNLYWTSLRHQGLLLMGVPPPHLEALESRQWEKVLAPAEVALMEFAVRLALQGTAIARQDLENLRALQWRDEALLDTVLTVARANHLCTLSIGLGPELDFAPPQFADMSFVEWPEAAAELRQGPYLQVIEPPHPDAPPFTLFKETFGFLPNVYKAQSSRPDVLLAEAAAIDAFLLMEDRLKRIQKERILLAVSGANQSDYFVTVHAEVLSVLGIPPDQSYLVAEDHTQAGLTKPDRALIDLAVKLASEPLAFSRSDVEILRRQGFSDEQVLEAVAATAFTNFLNTLQMGLGAVPDFPPRRSFQRPGRKNPNLTSPQSRLTAEGQIVDPDGELVRKAQTGDLDAFEALMQLHRKRVYRTLVGILGDQEEARDALQETFLKTFQHLARFERRSKFSTWLVSIASNAGLERLRQRRPVESLDREGSKGELEFRPRHVIAWTQDPERLYAQTEMRALVERSIMALPAKYRTVVLLRDFEQLGAEEAATALGISVPALKSRLLRGRLLLREALAPHFAKKGVEA